VHSERPPATGAGISGPPDRDAHHGIVPVSCDRDCGRLTAPITIVMRQPTPTATATPGPARPCPPNAAEWGSAVAEVSVRMHPDGRVRVAVSGVLDGAALVRLDEMLEALLRGQAADLVLDLAGLADFPCALFRHLHLWSGARGATRPLRLVGLDTAIDAVVGISTSAATPAHPDKSHRVRSGCPGV
jgi:hypothetical protein